jgi:hypothetical protein
MMTGLTLILTAFVVAGTLLLFFILIGAFHRSRARRLGAGTPGAHDAATLPLMMNGSAQTSVLPETPDYHHHHTHSGADHSHGHHSGMDFGHHGGGGFDGGASHGGGFDGGGHH